MASAADLNRRAAALEAEAAKLQSERAALPSKKTLEKQKLRQRAADLSNEAKKLRKQAKSMKPAPKSTPQQDPLVSRFGRGGAGPATDAVGAVLDEVQQGNVTPLGSIGSDSSSGVGSDSSSGGSGAAPSLDASGAAPAPTTDQSAVEEYITQNYPQFAWLTSNPELMDLFRRSMDGRWSPTKFTLELQKTEWWATTSEATRRYEATKATDNASWSELITKQRNIIADAVSRLGADISSGIVMELAENSLRFDWSPEQIDDALANHVAWGSARTGLAAGAQQLVRGVLDEYAFPLSQEEQARWSRRLLTGEATEESFRAYAVEQAKSLYPTLGPALDRGISVRSYVDPYIQITAEELGLPVNAISLSDPKFSRFLNQIDPKTNEPYMMNTYEWRKTIRTDPAYEWHKSKSGLDRADAVSLFLEQQFQVA